MSSEMWAPKVGDSCVVVFRRPLDVRSGYIREVRQYVSLVFFTDTQTFQWCDHWSTYPDRKTALADKRVRDAWATSILAPL